MGQISKKLRSAQNGGLMFWCPGCIEIHAITTGPNGWTYNGNPEQPTFQPSVLVSNGHYASTFKPGEACWCTFNAKRVAEGKEPSAFTCHRCHSFVIDGRIQFLGDSTHALAGQTVDLPDLPEHMRD